LITLINHPRLRVRRLGVAPKIAFSAATVD